MPLAVGGAWFLVARSAGPYLLFLPACVGFDALVGGAGAGVGRGVAYRRNGRGTPILRRPEAKVLDATKARGRLVEGPVEGGLRGALAPVTPGREQAGGEVRYPRRRSGAPQPDPVPPGASCV